MAGKRITIDLTNLPDDQMAQSEILLALRDPLNAIREAIAGHKAVGLAISFSALHGPKGPRAPATKPTHAAG